MQEKNVQQARLRDMEPKFRGRAVVVIVIVMIMMFLNGSAASDSINVITNYFPNAYGWSQTSVALPQTIGSWASVPLIALAAYMFARMKTLNILRVTFLIQGLAIIGIGLTAGNYAAYLVFAIIVRLCSTFNTFGTYKMCTDWFNSWRGRVLGIVTIAGPISSASTAGVLTAGNAAIGFGPTFIIFGAVVLVFCVACTFVSRSMPEDYGLYVDGIARTKEELKALDADMDTPGVWSLKAMLRTRSYWIITLALAFFAFAMVGTMQNFINICMSRGLELPHAIIALSVGSLLGIPISMISGVIDDKFGTNKAAFFVWLLMFGLILCIIFVSPANTWLIYVATFCVGACTGCFPNINPSIKAYSFGRKAFVAANSVSSMIENVMMGLPLMYLALMFDIFGDYKLAYSILAVITLVFGVLLLTVKPMAPEVIGVEKAREYAEKALGN